MVNLKLLIIEDDEEDFQLLVETLLEIKDYSFEISWSPTYNKALEVIGSQNFDLYIVDYLLGAYSGLDITRKIRSLEILSPIILLTGKGDSNVDHKASDSGVNDYIVKSDIDVTNLERCIRYALKNSEILTQLKLSEIKYRSVLRQSQDILFIADPQGKVLSISDSLFNITGYSSVDFSIKGLETLFSEETVKEKIKEAQNNKLSFYSLPSTIIAKNGEKLSVLLTLNYQQDTSLGDFIHGVIIDKTEELRSQHLKLVYEKLESTARLMRTLAHEVRNPLSNISLALEGLQAEDFNSPYLQIIGRNADRIENIIKKVLNFTHIEVSDYSVQNLVEVLNDTLGTIVDKADLQKIELVTILPEKYSFSMNAEQIGLSISNILVNAVEALAGIENGKITIQIIKNRLYIIDNGPGIAKSDQSVIFEPYFTKKKNGIGLGLASSMSILKAHKISLELDSDTGKGATFILSLPADIPIE